MAFDYLDKLSMHRYPEFSSGCWFSVPPLLDTGSVVWMAVDEVSLVALYHISLYNVHLGLLSVCG